MADVRVGTGEVTGNEAHDEVDVGNPNKIGAKAIAFSTNPTEVVGGDRTDLYANTAGVLFVIGGHPNIISREYMTTGAQTNDAIVTIAGGTKIVITAIEAIVSNATSVDVGVRIGLGTAAVPAEPTTGNSVTNVVLSHPGIAPGSGVVRGSGAGILASGTDNLDLRITNDVPTGGQLTVLVSYFTIES